MQKDIPSMKAPAVGVHADESDTPNRLLKLCPDHGTYWWNVPHLRTLNICLLIPILTSYVSGFDGSVMNGMQGVPVWQQDFDHPTGGILGLLATMQVIGGVAALPFAPIACDRFGRRHPICFGSLILVLGAGLQSGAQNLGMFIAGRGLIGFGNSFIATASSPLIAELAYPTHRPILTALYNTTWYLGSIVAAWTTYGTFAMSSSWSWRIPSMLQALPSLIQISCVYFIPESPRWLIAQERHEEAAKILTKYHAGTDQPTELIAYEVAEITAAIRKEKICNTSSYLDFFNSAGNRHRLIICISLGFLIQWCGNGLVSFYLIQVLNSIGITEPKTQNIINGVLQIFNYFTAVSAAFSIDRFGRRSLFLLSTFGMALAFVIWTAVSAVNQQRDFESKGLGIGVVVMIFVFFFFYNIAMSPVPVTYLMEVLPFTLRTKGLTIFNTSQFSSLVFNGFANPIALAAIGWKYYIVYVCLLPVWFVMIWFIYPETRGLSLEEVSGVFDKDTPSQREIDDKVEQIQQAGHEENVEVVR